MHNFANTYPLAGDESAQWHLPLTLFGRRPSSGWKRTFELLYGICDPIMHFVFGIFSLIYDYRSKQ